MFPTVVQTKDPAHRLLDLMDRAGPHRAACGAFLVREVDFEAVGILILDAGAGESLGGPIAKAGDVPSEKIQRRLALDHPFGGEFAHAAALAKARNDAAAAEIAEQAGGGAEEHVGIR